MTVPRAGAFVRESLPQFGGELESLVVGHPPGPPFRGLAIGRPVKGRIDLDGVEILREIGERVEPSGLRRGIDRSPPVLVIPAGDAKTDHGERRETPFGNA